ncbi:MAG TPA: hypothetical protein VKA54_22655 [Gemmatimonadaceae bacterium]|nr:hypothetical protein [Gemmatimonadaceae bacterium]
MKHPRTIAAIALFLAACSDNPVAPKVEASSMAPRNAAFSAGASSAALDFTDLANDMVGRVLPSFDDQQVATVIETSMLQLNAHAIAGEIAEAQAASQVIRSSLKEGAASAAHLDAMQRTLDVVDRDLAAAAAVGGDATLAP